MTTPGPRSGLVVPPNLQPLASVDTCQRLFNDILELDPADIAKQDVGLLNLLCAPGLVGSEGLNVARCMARLDSLAAFVRASTERGLGNFRSSPDYGHCEPMWRMALLVTKVKRDYGAAYDPGVRADLQADGHSPMSDASNVFVHGLLDDDANRRLGSCSSIPVLVAAVARRLGYPVRLAVNRRHVYARWDDGQGFAFNVEASNPAGMTVLPEDHYWNDFGPVDARERASGLYCRSLTPAEAFALFLKQRSHALHDQARYDETLLWSARSLQFSPTQPYFAVHAHQMMELGLKHRYRRKYPDRPIPPPERNHEWFYHPGELLAIEELSPFLTIEGHYHEYYGRLDQARRQFEDACRYNFFGNNEQRDLQRFMSKHRLTRRPGPPVWPKGANKAVRRTKVSDGCPLEQEAGVLQRFADECERRDELLRAMDALHDLYFFDPCDAEVFRRAREIEARPQYRAQCGAALAKQRQVLQQASHHPKFPALN